MDLDQVTLTQMRYAVAVLEVGSFRVAARRCHVSQSGLSMQIQKLEALLDVVLFDRSRKPVLATEEGRTAVAQMRAILRETERLGQLVSEAGEPSGRFRLGCIPTLSPTVLPLFLRTFCTRYPRVELVIEELETDRIIQALQSDAVDAGLASTPLSVPGLHEEALGRETMLAYLPPGDSLLAKQTIRQSDLNERPLWVMPEGHCFRSQVLSYCSARRVAQRGVVHFESGSFETLIRLVDEGLGATVLPALVAARLPARTRRARVRPLVAPTPMREIGLLTSRTDLRKRVHAALAETIREALNEALEAAPRRAKVMSPRASEAASPEVG